MMLKLISWNIDGLNENHIRLRTNAAIELIKEHSPDVLFLQEVVGDTISLLNTSGATGILLQRKPHA